MKQKKPLLLSLVCLAIISARGISQDHPHILVNDSDRQLVLNKIDQQPWASSIFKEIVANISPYVERHITDPEWILSRYLMNRIPGKRYTRVYSDNQGSRLVRWEGDAPVPTVRVSTHLRTPTTPSGASFRRPRIGELVPYDTARVMYLTNNETGQKEWVAPQAMITDINGQINDLALDASIVYWLNGEAKYAKFAADILDQWAKGAYYQEPIIGACRTGFLDIQSLGDQSYRSLILAYDFVLPYMKEHGYDLHYYETVFDKFASTMAFHGFWNNNWYGAESSTLVFAALSLENRKQRDFYLQFYLDKDTINGSCGQLALPSTVEKWLTPDGHWKEPGGYHNYPVSNLLLAGLAMEKNGYDIFHKFPALFKATYAMVKYSFPDLTESAFGDTGHASQSPETLEIGIIGALKYHQPELDQMLATINKLIEGGRYKRENSGYLGLLCFIPSLPAVNTVYSWPRSGTLDFAKFFLQRNGTEPVPGLMFGVQGASYNHNHCNGMAMELYGKGVIMGIDAGTGPNYEHPLHVNYYSQWAAHNTVVAAGMSSSVPFSGTAGRKDIGQIELAAMEPMPDKDAMSPDFSFTDTRYFDKSTQTGESRTLALIRTSDTSGYYVDIYRSDNPVSNDYVYHNIGDSLSLLTTERKHLVTAVGDYPLTGKDYPGFRFFTQVRKLENWSDNLVAVFSAKDDHYNDIFMQLLMPGKPGRVYYQAMSPKTKTSGRVYAGKSLPVFTMRDNGESKENPFITVFEPYAGKDGYTVDRISLERRMDGREFTALTVFDRNSSRQMIFQALDPLKSYNTDDCTFSGYFGVVSFNGDRIASMYLGQGRSITYKGYSFAVSDSTGSVSLYEEGKNFRISCDRNTIVTIPPRKVKKVTLLTGTKMTKIRVKRTPAGLSLDIPANRNGLITFK